MPRHLDEMTPELERAAELLREFPEPGELFRARVLTAVRRAPAAPPARRLSMHPWVAVAAAVACIAVGAGGTLLVRRPAATPVVAAPLLAGPVTLPVRFSLSAPGAQRVYLVGDFNQWSADNVPLQRSRDGRTWTVELRLPPGRYEYSFVVDGKLARDPVAPVVAAGEFGEPNSVVMVGTGE